MSYNLHKYWVMNDGEVKHDDYANDCVDESNDFSWPSTYYTINVDLLPDELKHAEDDEKLHELILAYHHKETEKPDWIVE